MIRDRGTHFRFAHLFISYFLSLSKSYAPWLDQNKDIMISRAYALPKIYYYLTTFVSARHNNYHIGIFTKIRIIFEISHWFILVWLNMQIVTMYDLRSYFIHIQTPSEEVFNCLLHAVKILFYTWYHQNIDKCKNKYNKTPRYVLWYVFQDIVFEKQ